MNVSSLNLPLMLLFFHLLLSCAWLLQFRELKNREESGVECVYESGRENEKIQKIWIESQSADGKRKTLIILSYFLITNVQNENLNLNENKHLYYISFYGHCTCLIKFLCTMRLLILTDYWHKKKVNNRLVSTSSYLYTCEFVSGEKLVYTIHCLVRFTD